MSPEVSIKPLDFAGGERSSEFLADTILTKTAYS